MQLFDADRLKRLMNRLQNMRFFLFVLCVVSYQVAGAQQVQQKLPEKTRILFLLDGSGSMLAKWGETTRIDAARTLLADLVDSLKVQADLQLALRAYGHRFSRQAQNCNDTKLEVGFASNNHNQIITKLAQIQPKGTTPIAYSLEQAATDFPNDTGYRNIVIIITDGLESCDGDPCAASVALQRKGVFLKPFVIGIGMDLKFKKEFDCLGTFYDASDQLSFKKALNKALNTTLEKTTASVLLLDQNNNPSVTNINVSFQNSFTNQSVADYVHYLDKAGNPDSVEIDAVLSYNVVANTIPPAIKRNVLLKPGTHNVIRVPTPLGSLDLRQSGSRSYPNDVQAIIKQQGRIIHIQPMNTKQAYLEGVFDIELLTLPRTIYRNIKITAGRTKAITLPSPGILNIRHNAAGYGSIYKINQDGSQEWVYDLAHDTSTLSITLQPGDYKVVFRADRAPGSKYTAIKTINIVSNKSHVLNLFN